jgi:pentatricopeptide repeat protein
LISQEFVANLTRLVASGQLHDAVRLFAKEARRVPISAVPSSVWQSFVAACAMCGDARTADSIVQLLTPHLAVADPAALERIQLGAINAHRRAGNYHKVRQLADLLPTKALRAFDLRVRAAATADEALQILAEARSTPDVVFDARFYVSLLEKCRFDPDAGDFVWRLAHTERALWTSKPLERESVLCARIVSLASLADPHYSEELVELWTELAELRPDAADAAAAAAAASPDANVQFAPTSRLTMWSSQRKSAYFVTCSFCARIQHRLVPALLRLSRGAVSSLLSPDVDLFQAAVLQTIRQLADPDRRPQRGANTDSIVNQLLAHLPSPTEHVRAPDRVLLNCVVSLLTRTGRMDDAVAFVDRVYPRYGFEADSTTLTTLLRGWIDDGSVFEAQRIFDRLAERNGDRSPFLFTELYRAAGAIYWTRGDELFDRIEQWRGDRFLNNMSVLNARLSVLVRLGRYEAADALVADMRARGLTPDRYTFNTILFAIAQQHKVLSAAQPPNLVRIADLDKRMRAILTDMSVAGCDPDISTFTILISMSRNTAQCRAMYERMLAQGIRPDKILAVGLVNAALKCETFSVDYVEYVLGECWKVNARPARAKLRLLIQFALRAGQDEFAIRMLNDFEARRLLDMKDEGGLMLAFVAKLVVANEELAAVELVQTRFANAQLEHMMLELFLRGPHRRAHDSHWTGARRGCCVRVCECVCATTISATTKAATSTSSTTTTTTRPFDDDFSWRFRSS